LLRTISSTIARFVNALDRDQLALMRIVQLASLLYHLRNIHGPNAKPVFVNMESRGSVFWCNGSIFASTTFSVA